jgi:hypothetical protein
MTSKIKGPRCPVLKLKLENQTTTMLVEGGKIDFFFNLYSLDFF